MDALVPFAVRFLIVALVGIAFSYFLLRNYEDTAMNESTPDERAKFIWRFAIAGGLALGFVWTLSLFGFDGLHNLPK